MITDKMIQQTVQKIKENIKTEKIVLFGSYASGIKGDRYKRGQTPFNLNGQGKIGNMDGAFMELV